MSDGGAEMLPGGKNFQPFQDRPVNAAIPDETFFAD